MFFFKIISTEKSLLQAIIDLLMRIIILNSMNFDIIYQNLKHYFEKYSLVYNFENIFSPHQRFYRIIFYLILY